MPQPPGPDPLCPGRDFVCTAWLFSCLSASEENWQSCGKKRNPDWPAIQIFNPLQAAGKVEREVHHKHLFFNCISGQLLPDLLCTFVFVQLIFLFPTEKRGRRFYFERCNFPFHIPPLQRGRVTALKAQWNPMSFSLPPSSPLLTVRGNLFFFFFLQESHSESQNDGSRKTNSPIIPIPLSTVHPVGSNASQTFRNKGQLVFRSLHEKRGWSCFGLFYCFAEETSVVEQSLKIQVDFIFFSNGNHCPGVASFSPASYLHLHIHQSSQAKTEFFSKLMRCFST